MTTAVATPAKEGIPYAVSLVQDIPLSRIQESLLHARWKRSDPFAAKEFRKTVNTKPPRDGPRLSCIAGDRRILE